MITWLVLPMSEQNHRIFFMEETNNLPKKKDTNMKHLTYQQNIHIYQTYNIFGVLNSKFNNINLGFLRYLWFLKDKLLKPEVVLTLYYPIHTLHSNTIYQHNLTTIYQHNLIQISYIIMMKHQIDNHIWHYHRIHFVLIMLFFLG